MNAEDREKLRIMMHELSAVAPGIEHTVEECIDDYADLHESEIIALLKSIKAFASMNRILLQNYRSALMGGRNPVAGLVEPIDLWAIVRECVEVCDRCQKLEADSVELEYRVDLDGAVFIEGVDPEIRRALINILTNAQKYSFRRPMGGVPRYILVLGRRWRGSGAMIRVTNFGVGILEREIEHVTNSETRGELAKREGRYGSGIGLSEVKKIVAAHRGELDIRSTLVADGRSESEVVQGLGASDDAFLTWPWKTEVTIRLEGR